MKKSKIIMILGSLILLVLFVLPLWNISLEAPQYPEQPLGMNIYINKLTDRNPDDLRNINIMNHYVGMKAIPDKLKEFEVFPIVVLFMVGLGVLIGLKARYKWYLAWFVVMSILGIIGIYDFYLWLLDYGTNLDPKAPIKFTNPDGTAMAYTPPLLGTKTILNFVAHSYPGSGGFFLFGGMFLSLTAFFLGRKEARQTIA